MGDIGGVNVKNRNRLLRADLREPPQRPRSSSVTPKRPTSTSAQRPNFPSLGA
jgi:hypothetical protein